MKVLYLRVFIKGKSYKYVQLPSKWAQISSSWCFSDGIGSSTCWDNIMIENSHDWLTLSSVRQDYFYGLWKPSFVLPSIFALKQSWPFNKPLITKVRQWSVDAKFKKIILRTPPEAILWGKFEVILKFGTWRNTRSSKTSLYKQKLRFFWVIHQFKTLKRVVNLKNWAKRKGGKIGKKWMSQKLLI